ncbi:hypothetical protein FA002_14415 [Priestia megaterium]|uniref:hypothetical protein n=1 Tax=Priestia megaterium TaxID=1404 RepID=UPI0010AD941A|nr:hypothetical protein [Priestia megaterium]TJZ36983.1 hypothetical protein FA002_14415 [Priestia megaterium]
MRKHRTYETLVDLYQKSAKIHYEIDYRDKKSVKKGNRAAEDMKKIAQLIHLYYPGMLFEFATLLTNPTYRIDLWAAHHVLEIMSYSPMLEDNALSVIERYADENDFTALGNRMWLDQWREKQR